MNVQIEKQSGQTIVTYQHKRRKYLFFGPEQQITERYITNGLTVWFELLESGEVGERCSVTKELELTNQVTRFGMLEKKFKERLRQNRREV